MVDPLVVWEASLPIQIKNKNKHNNKFSFFIIFWTYCKFVNLYFINISVNFLSKYLFSVLIIFIAFLDGGTLEKQLLLKGHPP